MTLDVLNSAIYCIDSLKTNKQTKTAKKTLPDGRNDRLFPRSIRRDFGTSNVSSSFKPKFILFSLSMF